MEPDQSFSVTVLPRRSWRCRSIANAHRANAARKCLAVDTVAITNEVIRHRLPPAGLADLPSDPFRGRRPCDANRVLRRSTFNWCRSAITSPSSERLDRKRSRRIQADACSFDPLIAQRLNPSRFSRRARQFAYERAATQCRLRLWPH